MRKIIAICMSVVGLYLSSFPQISAASTQSDSSPQKVKEWTFLIYLNGNNSLDYFSTLNLNQIEQVGSTDDVNVVVQWASLSSKKTQRLFMIKDNDTSKVTSPIVQDVGTPDMGDWRTLVEFVQWGVANYPAKHYFIDVWDHGSGWHATRTGSSVPVFFPMDISLDDNTGHAITTQQLGEALRESAKIIGHKVDLYGSDACLMAMAEVATEVSDAVSVFAGSEEVEPAQGWPYHSLLKRWTANPKMPASQVGTILTEEYTKSYMGGDNGTRDATFSVYNLDKKELLNHSILKLGKALASLDQTARSKVVQAASSTQSFTFNDYVDLSDFLLNLDNAKIDGVNKTITKDARTALSQFVIANSTTPSYSKAKGVAIWFPSTSESLKTYSDRYKSLKFDEETKWGDALEALLK